MWKLKEAFSYAEGLREGQALNSRLTEASTIGNKTRRVYRGNGQGQGSGSGREGKGRGWVEQLK